jgi:glucokinase
MKTGPGLEPGQPKLIVRYKRIHQEIQETIDNPTYMSLHAIGIDLGGTRIKGVAIDPAGNVLDQCYTPTSDGEGQPWKSAIRETVEALKPALGQAPFVTGISAPGIPSMDNRSIAHMPGRLQGLEGFDWGDYLGCTAFVANDAIAAMAAEARFGEARGLQHAILLTLGTGVGGAILINGQIYQGAYQKAGHLGHMSVDHAGEQDICNLPGSLEDAIGNCSIGKRSLGKYAYTHQLLDDYRKGDPFASWLWLDSVRKLAVSIAGLTNVLSPEKVILGGGITEAGDDLFKPLASFLSRYEWRAGGHAATVVRARFGDLAGAIGAAGFGLMKQDRG